MAIDIFNPDLVKSTLESVAKGGAASGSSSVFSPERSVFPSGSGAVKGPAESQFEQALQETISRVNDTQNSADRSVARLASGQEANIHHTMLELEQADISMKLAMQVRSKVLDAYQEIMRMQV